MEARFVESEQSAREGLAMRESAFGPNDASVADSLNTLALVRDAQGHPDEAEALDPRALAIWEKALGPNHVRVAMVANNLAIAYRDQKKLDEAASLLQRLLVIRETVNGPDHLDVARGSVPWPESSARGDDTRRRRR